MTGLIKLLGLAAGLTLIVIDEHLFDGQDAVGIVLTAVFGGAILLGWLVVLGVIGIAGAASRRY